jgi:hypothetical protein
MKVDEVYIIKTPRVMMSILRYENGEVLFLIKYGSERVKDHRNKNRLFVYMGDELGDV